MIKQVKKLTITAAMLKEERFFKDWIEAYWNYLLDNTLIDPSLQIIGIDIYGEPTKGLYVSEPIPKNEVLAWTQEKLKSFANVQVIAKSSKYIAVAYPKSCWAALYSFLEYNNLCWQHNGHHVNKIIDFKKSMLTHQPTFFK